MNLVCFPGLTAGALICNLLNQKFIPITDYTVQSKEHNVFKTGPEEGFQVYQTYVEKQWEKQILKYSKSNLYFGTHCHPTCIKSLNNFDKIIVITVTTIESKLYRFLRNVFIHKLENKKEICGNAKMIIENNFEPFPNCINIEFENIVNGKFVEDNKLNINYFNDWKKYNNYLYEPDPVITNYFYQTISGE